MEALKKENDDLRKAIRQFKVERNRLENQLYRAFRQCLNAKKRKIVKLQFQLDALRSSRSNDYDGNETPSQKRSKHALPDHDSTSDDDEVDSDETTIDEQVNYEDVGEFEVDQAPPSTSASLSKEVAVTEFIEQEPNSPPMAAVVSVPPQKTKVVETKASVEDDDDDDDSDDDSCIPLPKAMRKRAEARRKAQETNRAGQ